MATATTESGHLKLMADEVADLIQNRGLDFRTAFANVAHRRGIWHHRNDEQYNYHFRAVMEKVKKKIGREAVSQACRKKPTPPPLPKTDFKRLAGNDRDDD